MNNDQFSAAQSHCSSIAPSLPEIGSDRHTPTLSFNPEAYRNFLADCDWTDSQKDEFTQALWEICLNFVDLGFGLHPLQQVEGNITTLATDSAAVISSHFNSHSNLEKVADDLAGPFAEEK